jgi:hypothetical protein
MDDLWRQVRERLAADQAADREAAGQSDADLRGEVQQIMARLPFAEAVGRGVDWFVDGTFDPRLGPMGEDQAVDAAIELALNFNPEGWADMPQDPAERHRVVLAFYQQSRLSRGR